MLQHFACTGYGISSESYGSKIDHHRGTGQGNLFACELYKVKLYLIIKKLENEKKGVNIKAPISNKEINQTVIAFVNGTSFYSNRCDCNIKIQKIVKEYTKLYKAIGGKVKQDKSFCYA